MKPGSVNLGSDKSPKSRPNTPSFASLTSTTYIGALQEEQGRELAPGSQAPAPETAGIAQLLRRCPKISHLRHHGTRKSAFLPLPRSRVRVKSIKGVLVKFPSLGPSPSPSPSSSLPVSVDSVVASWPALGSSHSPPVILRPHTPVAPPDPQSTGLPGFKWDTGTTCLCLFPELKGWLIGSSSLSEHIVHTNYDKPNSHRIALHRYKTTVLIS